MTASETLIAAFKAARNLPNDAKAAQALRVTAQTLSNWKLGKSRPAPASVAKMCEATGEPVGKWLALIEADRTTNAADRNVWRKIAKNAAALAAILLSALAPQPAQASTEIPAHNQGTMVIMLNNRRGPRWFSKTIRPTQEPAEHQDRAVGAW